MNKLDFAKYIVNKSFEGKVDLAGEPKLDHINRIFLSLGHKPQETQICALLHDLVEDCSEWTLDTLRHFFWKETVHSVDCLTHRPGEAYHEYIDRVMTDRTAMDVKLADLRDNMSIWRLPKLKDSDHKRLDKYLYHYHRILKHKNS